MIAPHTKDTGCPGWWNETYGRGQCRPCWLIRNPETYRNPAEAIPRPLGAAFGSIPQAYRSGLGAKLLQLQPCIHRGKTLVRRLDPARVCGCVESGWDFECNFHKTTCNPGNGGQGVRGCERCLDFTTVVGSNVPAGHRHLLFFIYPVKANKRWRDNVDEVLQRLTLFNGRRVVAISTGCKQRKLEDPDVVREYFGKDEADFLFIPAHKTLGEVTAFVPMWQRLLLFNREDDYAFYCHSKSVTKPRHETAWRWAKLMYAGNLDHWDRVRPILKKKCMAGCFMHIGHMGPGYNGTFYWARCRDVFKRHWRDVPQHYGGTELWPARTFPNPAEMGSIFGPDHAVNLYEPAVMSKMEAEYEKWKAEKPKARRRSRS